MRHTPVSFIFLSLLCCGTALQAQTQQKLSIESATVFLKGAQLTSTAKVHLEKGENEFLFSNVAGDVNDQSLTVSAGSGVVVESATFRNNYLVTDNVTPRTHELKDSIELIAEMRSSVANKIAVLTEQLTVLQDNRKVSGSNTGLSVAELSKMLDLISTKMEAYLNQKNRQELLLKKIDERLANMNNQLSEERKRSYQPGGQLLVKFYAKEANTTPVNINYIAPNAGWSPTYDVRVDNVSEPAALYYKANVYQNSGVKWDNVHLSLSTGNPQEGADAPVMSPWYLAFYMPPAAAPMATGMVKAYRKKLVNDEKMATMDMAGEVPVLSTMNEYVTADNAGINTTFDIDLPYTIANDGQQHLVAIKKYDLPATYRYYAAPKLDKDVFLQALATSWEDLNLIPGPSNIFYDGTYVGQGYIDTRNVKDTMLISLGRDKKIIVKREQDKKLRSVKTIGTSVRETFAYTITVRNTRKEAVHLVLQDQLPVSNDKDIVLEDLNTGDAGYDEATGSVKWQLTLAPNESRSIPFGFTVKYPKGKQINNLR